MIIAKIAAYSVTGALFGTASAVLVAAVVLPAMAIKQGPVSLLVYDVPIILGGTVLASALFALIGLGVGALIHNQVAAIALAVGWLWLTEIVIISTVPAAGKRLPDGTLQAPVQGTPDSRSSIPDLLPVASGAALLLGYGVVFTAAAAVTTIRRDIT